jgi:hypothetical protein
MWHSERLGKTGKQSKKGEIWVDLKTTNILNKYWKQLQGEGDMNKDLKKMTS